MCHLVFQEWRESSEASLTSEEQAKITQSVRHATANKVHGLLLNF